MAVATQISHEELVATYGPIADTISQFIEDGCADVAAVVLREVPVSDLSALEEAISTRQKETFVSDGAWAAASLMVASAANRPE